MKYVFQIIKEQFMYLPLTISIAGFDLKGQYRMHYLGILWEFISAAIQVLAYWFVFGVGIRGGADVDGIPFVLWLLVGLIPWFFINSSITQGSKSVLNKVGLVARMNFPISILPTITMAKNVVSFVLLSVLIVVILFVYGFDASMSLLQLPYYLFAMFAFLFSVTILFSTISVIIRDFMSGLNAVMRMFFFLTPVLWDASDLPDVLVSLLQVNPLYYIVMGIRDSVFSGQWFFEDMPLTIYFWSITLLILFVGCFVHIKFRNKFVDYL